MLSMVLLPFNFCFSTSSFNFINIQYIFYIHSLGKQWSSNLELLPSFLSYAMDILLANNFFFLVFFYQFYYSFIHLTCSVISSIKSSSSFLHSYFFSVQFPIDIALFYCYSSLSILICLLLIIYFCYLFIS